MTAVMALVVMLTMTGCSDSEAGVSSATTSTVASSQEANAESQPTQNQANAESQPTQDPANVKPMPTGPQPTALPTQPVPLQGTDADGDGFYTTQEFQAAITALFDYYEWPAGYMPDVPAITAGFDEPQFAGITHEVPGQYTIVGGYFTCAWGQTWLDAFAGGDIATMDFSMQNLRAELALNPMNVPATQAHFQNMYDTASLGDPALLRRHVDANCGGMEWLDQPSTTG